MAAPSELIRKIRRIEITTRRAVLDTLAGGYHSVFKGRGMAFSEVRPYQPGDEIRAIDWNVTARIGEPFVKVFVEERELTALIAVDRSASQGAGLSAQAKAEVAAEIAALLVFSALENGDRAGLLLFTDRVERFVPPRRGRKHGLRLISEALAFRPGGRGTDVALALRDVTRFLRRRAVVFVVSDFLASDYEAALAVCARRHDVIPVVVSDPVEDELPAHARRLRRGRPRGAGAARAHLPQALPGRGAGAPGRRLRRAAFRALPSAGEAEVIALVIAAWAAAAAAAPPAVDPQPR